MRKTRITPGEHYHIYNRGNDKQLIFRDNKDRARFLFLILYFQAPVYFENIRRFIAPLERETVVPLKEKLLHDFAKKRAVLLENFALMPNHFHLLAYELSAGGISRYMQRALNSYTKYFNAKYHRSGHLFEGTFQVVHIKTNKQLLHVSAYIHRNPREIKIWGGKEHLFPWSSFRDFVGDNRWGKFLHKDILMEQFENNKEYLRFVNSSPAKRHLNEELLIDLRV